eukprot:scaffold2018_cov113-Cylindrotheca_fusiformis.AAC.3
MFLVSRLCVVRKWIPNETLVALEFTIEVQLALIQTRSLVVNRIITQSNMRLWRWQLPLITFHASPVIAFSTFTEAPNTTFDRRGWLHCFIGASTALCQVTLSAPTISHAKSLENRPKENPLKRLIEAQDTLDKLLSNWKRATIDCTFADVPRELLEAKNKELLLEKASTFALFDKSVSVETCKTNNRIVRDYLGVTGKGPLVGIDKLLKLGLDFVDPEYLDDYVTGKSNITVRLLLRCRSSHPCFSTEELESFSQALAKASSLSYTAGVGDFDGKSHRIPEIIYACQI